MKTIKNYVAALLLMVLVGGLISCNRTEEEPATPSPTASQGFTWRENATDAPLKTAGSSEVRTQYKSIFAFTGTTATSGTLFEFNLTAVTPGTYPINASNAFYFSGNTATPASGEVVITSNSGGKASGTFKATWTAGAISAVYGTFTDIPVK